MKKPFHFNLKVPTKPSSSSKKKTKKATIISSGVAKLKGEPLAATTDDEFASILNSLHTLSFAKKDGADLPNPVDQLLTAIDADFDLSVFGNDAFPTAPNVIEWCRGREYLNSSVLPFPKQFQTMVHFCQDACYFCSDLEFLFDMPIESTMGEMLDRTALLEYGVCPVCRRNRIEIQHEWVVDPRFFTYHNYEPSLIIKPAQYNELCAVWGQRAGKSLVASTFLATYNIHRYLGLPDPMRYYGEPANKVIEGTFVAPIIPQVNTYLWTPFIQAIGSSPWYKEVVDHYKFEGKRLGVKLVRSGSTFMLFVAKRLALHMAAANSSTLRGGTRILYSYDELGWSNYDQNGTKRTNSKSGEEVFTSLNNSTSTLRSAANSRWRAGDYNALQAVGINISSPSSKHDPIMQRAGASEKNQRIYFTHYSTFEVNPKENEEDKKEEYANDMERLMRDWYAIPPDAASPFFSDKRVLENRTFTKDEVPSPFSYDLVKVEDPANNLSMLNPTLKDVKADKLYPRILTVDNGENHNSFALCLGRYLPEIDGIVFEELMEVAPYGGRVVNLAWCHNEVVLKLVDMFNVLVVGYDRWNSGYSFYDLRTNKKVIAERYSLKWQDFVAFKEDLLGENIWFSPPEPEITIEGLLKMNDLAMRSRFPRVNLKAQIVTVNEFGRKLLKPDHGNDDLFRCAVLAHRLLAKYRKEFKEQARHVRARNPKATKVGVMRSNVATPGLFRLPKSAYGGFDYNGALGRPGGNNRVGTSRGRVN